MQFKTPRQQSEFEALPQHNNNLKLLLEDLDKYCKDAFGKEIMLTRIFCSKEEEDALYADNMSARPKVSPHEVWQGADLRSYTFSDSEINKIIAYANSRYKYHDGTHPVAMYHRVKNQVFHFHIQYF